ncbi:MAG: hypothetical protein MJA29_00445 [Candidatus Omnitrophica bacterium]|nr:hypothetical protein [Candidatus Omnitrophota bacterium]
MKRVTGVWIAVCMAAVTAQVAAYAATVQINPTKIRLAVSPGAVKSGVIEVKNPSEESLVVKTYVQDFRYTDERDGTKEFFTPGLTPTSCAEWISTSLNEFVIPPKGSQSISYTVRVPDDASGGHYAVLFFETLLSEPQMSDSAYLGVVVRIGSLFFIEPEGTIKRQAELGDLLVTRADNQEPFRVSMELTNTGNVDITTEASFALMDAEGMVAARGAFGDTYTFQKEKARLEGVWEETIPAGAYDMVITVNIGKGLQEAGLGRGPVVTAEVPVDIAQDGSIAGVGNMR